MGFLNLIFPKRCIFCEKVIEPFDNLCVSCEEKINSKIYDNTENCLNFNFDKVVSIYEYSGIIRDAVMSFKFNSKLINGKFFSEKLSELVLNKTDCNFDYIIGVPMTKEQKHKRGYNQSDVIAKYVAKKLKAKYSEKILEKVKDNKVQHKLNSDDRRRNVKGVFAMAKNAEIQGKSILLIDDIITTGSTLNECAGVLKSAGASKVCCATIAKTILNNC